MNQPFFRQAKKGLIAFASSLKSGRSLFSQNSDFDPSGELQPACQEHENGVLLRP